VASRIRGKELDVILSENPAVKVLGSHSMSRTASWRDDVRNGMQALILQNKGKFQGVWASWDGQAWIIDDLLRAQGFKKVRELPEWKKYTEDAAFNTTFMTGKPFADWVAQAEKTHHDLMQSAGFLAAK
jgi:hypothetical protein